ncbi:hypothetical protein BHM03_00024851 [Ensete ventricosum]|nr:hypothetical protein BHM03_00024851 [Ensete ventricosum]
MGTCRDGSSATAVPRRRRPRRLQRNRSVTWHDAQWMLPATLANSPGFSPQRTPQSWGPHLPVAPHFHPLTHPELLPRPLGTNTPPAHALSPRTPHCTLRLQFISKGSCTGYGGVVGSQPRTFLNRRVLHLRNQTTAYEGLRSRNVVDLIRMPPNAKVISGKTGKGTQNPSRRPLGVVICGKGMNIVFVGAEMAPCGVKPEDSVMFLEDCHRLWL